MAAKKNNVEHIKKKVTIPRGVAVFPHLVEPDTKYNPEGEYSVKVRVPQEQAQPLIDKLEAMWAEFTEQLTGAAKKKAPTSLGFEYEYDEDGEETGFVLFKTASYATIKGKPRTIPFFDSKGKSFTPQAVWGGSEIIVSSTAKTYLNGVNIGIKLYLDAVMVKKLVAGGSGDASSYGFEIDEDDDGFEASEMPQATPTDTPPFDADNDEDDF